MQILQLSCLLNQAWSLIICVYIMLMYAICLHESALICIVIYFITFTFSYTFFMEETLPNASFIEVNLILYLCLMHILIFKQFVRDQAILTDPLRTAADPLWSVDFVEILVLNTKS